MIERKGISKYYSPRLRELNRTFNLRNAIYWNSRWVRNSRTSEERPIILAGCDRSGTTLLRALLDSHPDIAIGPESWLFAWKPDPEFLSIEYDFEKKEIDSWLQDSKNLTDFVETFFSAYREKVGKTRWGEKSPANILNLDYILKTFPKSRVVHIVRDPRDVVCSLRTHPKRKRKGSVYVSNNIVRPIGECTRWWNRYVGRGVVYRGQEQYLEIRYEDLVQQPKRTLQTVLQHVDVPWDDSVLQHSISQSEHPIIKTEIVNFEARLPVNTVAIERWRKDLTEKELSLVLSQTKSFGRLLGYY